MSTWEPAQTASHTHCSELYKWLSYRDDVTHDGEKIDWGKWAITCDDPDFGGEGMHDTGEDYGPAPGETASHSYTADQGTSEMYTNAPQDLTGVLCRLPYSPCKQNSTGS